MKNVEIWAEGFKMGDTRAQAVRLAAMEAKGFDDACKKLVKQNDIFARHYDQRQHTFWGCKIFATETKARGRFG